MTKVIGTHNGSFHCDEALAVFMLRQTQAFKNSTLIRTRDQQKLDECDIVVDVGGVYDPEKNRYDHHQRGFFETFSPHHSIKLSSAGLIYKHFGKEIIGTRLNLNSTDQKLELLYQKVYEDFIEGLDAQDNGINRYPEECSAKYKDLTNLPRRVAGLNPWWNSKNPSFDGQFYKAVELTGSEFYGMIDYLGLAWLPARDIVMRAFEKRFEIDKSGKILVLDGFCPWKEHVFDLEKEQNIAKDENILYTVYPDEARGWRVQCVPATLDSYSSRKLLPEEWRGLRDSELSEKAKIEGCIFIHMTGFIGGNGTKDGALEMAKKALNS
ncbi:1918_t:CDS:10 [Ambispora gerdemannii]|uniref:1918_t:CDS:1 n=1 Tax=Ambispora gerdemannii TaxID=144530 RepID=A0A9N9DE82_9GLOM|nr:1918_t:CDS:10 [Ambispora gerdemannii]